MVQFIERTRPIQEFPESAPTANPVFYRTYSRRREDGTRETWQQVCDRTIQDIAELGQFSPQEQALVDRMQRGLKALSSGRALWVMGTDWIHDPENFSGAYNCTSTNVTDWRAFGLMMDLAMMGCGTGAVLEPKYIDQLPVIRNPMRVKLQGQVGTIPVAERQEETEVQIHDHAVVIRVGDSRRGWVMSYQRLLELSSDPRFERELDIRVDLSHVRPAGERLRGFGGVANPIKLPGLYDRCATILNRAVGRKLNSVECCLLIDEAAVTIVAGNIRRCLPEEALVHTESGLVPIAQVRIGDRVLTSKGFYPVTNLFMQGQQSLCRIQTQEGSFECTADHKVAVLTDVCGSYKMVKAKALRAGDRLIFVPQSLPGTPTELPEFQAEIKGTTQPIQIPALTPDVAYFLGYFLGDGSVDSDGSSVHFRIHEESPKILDHLIRVGQEFGLCKHTLRTPEQCKTKAYELQFHSSALNTYLRQFKRASEPLTVPDCVLLGTRDIRRSFLSGLADADGCHSQGVLVSSCERRFLQQVQAVYASLGITVRMCSSIRKSTGEGELVTVGAKAYSWSHTQHQMIVPTLKRLLPKATDLVPITVTGVEFDVRSAQTYDIEVASIHEFVCEGILVSNSAGMRQFDSTDHLGATAKDNLWQQGADGNWRIDPERDALRMANHTRVFHRKPTQEECIEAVGKQFYSGEGAIQWAGEAIARANRDLITKEAEKSDFLKAYQSEKGAEWLLNKERDLSPKELSDRLSRYGLNPCGEILGSDFHCNLSEVHLNQVDPSNAKEQEEAFTAGALSVAALLNHQFREPRYQYSRSIDPIVGVSFTGLFDFFVTAFGVEWLRWWQQGRPETSAGIYFKDRERQYLSRWREIVHRTVWDYCDRHGLRRPNRCTTVQPSGTKSLLTGASPGWHPPKSQRYIRRITFGKNDPVALACLEYGYSIVPSQSDKDENGNLLIDPFDPRCTEWLVELPVEVPWANLPGASEIPIESFSALAQFDFYLQVQRYYTTHNTSATIELREEEIEPLGQRIYEAIEQDQGYISAALLARFDAPFPRLPFEKIDKSTYDRLSAEVLARRRSEDFLGSLLQYDQGFLSAEGPAGCDAMGCLMPESTPQS